MGESGQDTIGRFDIRITGRLLDVNIPSSNPTDLTGPWQADWSVVSETSFSQNPEAHQGVFRRPSLQHTRDIRLLQVFSGALKTEIHCIFVPLSLSNPNIEYQAISYCWGSAEPSEMLWCSQKQYLLVTPSLYSILQILADEATNTYYWIDALCINQEDYIEKAHQIRLMRDIFASATQVIAFIGDPSTDSDLAMQFIENLKMSIEVTSVLHRTGLLKNVNKNLEFCDMAIIAENELTRYPSQSWTAFKDMIKRPWFQRSWCIQEVVVAKKVILRCGNQTADWADLAYAVGLLAPTGLAQLSTVDEHGLAHFRGCSSLRATFAIKGFEGVGVRHLQHCLLLGNEFSATLPQDRIFSMLGIAIDAADDELSPDYSVSTQKLYTDVTGYLFKRDHCFQLLQLAGIGWPRRLSDLPSWVPDFSTPRKSTILGTNSNYKASLPLSDSMEVNASSQLRCSWDLIDRVTESVRSMPELLRSLDRKESRGSRSKLIAWFEESLKWTLNLAPYPTGEDCNVVYWRTLICNMSLSWGFAAKKPTYTEYPERFNAMIELLRVSVYPDIDPEAEDALLFIILEERELLIKILLESRDRKLFRTQKGYLGFGPIGLCSGDWIGLVNGTNTPFLLRSRDHVLINAKNDDIYDLVGECYVHGIMEGEGRDPGKRKTIFLA